MPRRAARRLNGVGPGKDRPYLGVQKDMLESHRSRSRAALLTAGLLGALAVPVSASATATSVSGAPAAGELSASGGARLARTTSLVAGSPATITSSVYLWHSGLGCSAADLGPGSELRATFEPPAGVSLTSGSPATTTLTLPSTPLQLRDAAVFNASWSVKAAGPGVRYGRITWRATSVVGRTCTGVQELRIVASSTAPTLRVAGAVRRGHRLVVALAASLPGIDRSKLRGAFAEAVTSSFTEQHGTQDVDGAGGRGVAELLRPFDRGQRVIAERGFDERGVACVVLDGGLQQASALHQRLAFRWNGELGARPITTAGRQRIDTRPRTPESRRCAGDTGR